MYKKFFKRFAWPLAAVLAILIIYQYMRPVPLIPPVSQPPALPVSQPISLPWPAGGQAALGAAGYGILASHNTQTPVPIGSTAKVITALAVLKHNPISPGSQGPVFTLSSHDADLFDSYYTQDGSVTQVAAGEQITELQALQSMLIPSSNNMADSLAVWAFGSVDSYLAYANRMVKDMGLARTSVGDTNGFYDSTTSTADDLVRIGLAAINDPIIARIAGQNSAQIPVAGTVRSTNYALGKDNIVGIKTGNTDKAGGCYLFASKRSAAGHSIMVVGAVLGQPNLVAAINSASPLLDAGDNGFTQTTVIHKNQVLGYYKSSWGAHSQFKAASDLSLLAWKGADIKITSRPADISPSSAGTNVGKVSVSSLQQSAATKLVLSNQLPGPSPFWRFIR